MSFFSDISNRFFENGGLTVPEVSGLIAAGVFIGELDTNIEKPMTLTSLLPSTISDPSGSSHCLVGSPQGKRLHCNCASNYLVCFMSLPPAFPY